MNNIEKRRPVTALCACASVAVAVFLAVPGTARAGHVTDPLIVGTLSDLIPMHKSAITLYTEWVFDDEGNPSDPGLLFWQRPAEYSSIEMLNDHHTYGGATPKLGTGVSTGTTSLALGSLDEALGDAYDDTVLAGFGYATGPHGIDRDNVSRHYPDVWYENTLYADLTDPAFFMGSGEMSVGDIMSPSDFINDAAFTPAGRTLNLHNNIFCSGQAVDAHGRLITAGGHNINNNAGLLAVNMWTPGVGWRVRDEPETKKDYLAAGSLGADPGAYMEGFPPMGGNYGSIIPGVAGFADPLELDMVAAQLLPVDPGSVDHDREYINADPGVFGAPYDMKYRRWYPSVTAIPNDPKTGHARVIVGSGTTVPIHLGPPVVVGNFGAGNCQVRETARMGDPANVPPLPAGCFKDRISVWEVIDTETGLSTPIEIAPKQVAMFPQAYVVQMGKKKGDWRLLVMTEITRDEDLTDGTPYVEPSLAEMGNFNPWSSSGRTYLFDVEGALADPNVADPAAAVDGPMGDSSPYWTEIDTATHAHASGPSVILSKLDEDGKAISQLFVTYGGSDADPTARDPVSLIEKIDLSAPVPMWMDAGHLTQPCGDFDNGLDTRAACSVMGGAAVGDLLAQPATEAQAVVLPVGSVVIGGGVESEPRGPFGNWEGLSLHYQLHDPVAGTDPVMLAETTLPCHDHCTMLLMPPSSDDPTDTQNLGTVFRGGGNRADLRGVAQNCGGGPPGFGRAGPFFPTTCTEANLDQGVAIGQILTLPYLLTGNPVPVVTLKKMGNTPAGEFKYEDRVDLDISGVSASEIKSVVLIRSDSVSHSLNTDIRRLELWFEPKGMKKVSFQTPAKQGLAPPGYYYLYVVTEGNMPSVAKLVHFAG